MEEKKLMELDELKKFSDPQKKEIIKAAVTCPICGGKLKTSLMGPLAIPISYCPNCNIVKTEYLSIPVLCEECHSPIFIGLLGELLPFEEKQCWLCGGRMKEFSFEEFERLQREGLLKKGYHYVKASEAIREEIRKENKKCHHVPTEPIHWKDRTWYVQCKKCGYKEFFHCPPEAPRFPKKEK
jgi:tRNA U54 and U55 pseudouridine synthase Pus10